MTIRVVEHRMEFALSGDRIARCVWSDDGRVAVRWRGIIVVAIATWLSASPCFACTGELLFADDFSDPAQSKTKWKWSAQYPESLSFTKGYLEMGGIWGGNATIPGIEKDFDLCVDITTPKVKRPKIGAVADIDINYRQHRDQYTVTFGADAVVLVARSAPDNHGYELTPQRSYPGVKAGVGQKNSLRFLLKDGVGTVYVNGRQLFEFKQLVRYDDVPEVQLHGQSNDKGDGVWRFSNVKLAKPPRN
jgi:hypothetical protein